MDGGVLLLCRSLRIVCSHRPHSGFLASSSSSSSYNFPHFDSPEKFAGRVSTLRGWDAFASHRKWNALKCESESSIVESSGDSKPLSDWARDEESNKESPDLAIGVSRIHTDGIWDQCRRVVKTDETSDGDVAWLAANIMSKTSGHVGFAAISARTHRPPPLPRPQRSKVPKYVTGGVMLSLAAFIAWRVTKSETYARDQLISHEEAAAAPPSQQMVTAFEKAKASVAQAASVNRAVAAVRTNNLMECTVEMEIALEANRLARKSIESDFYEEEEVYQGVIKMWVDGYPLDYGKVLQLRNLLDLPGPKAEALEQEVLQQSDSYVI